MHWSGEPFRGADSVRYLSIVAVILRSDGPVAGTRHDMCSSGLHFPESVRRTGAMEATIQAPAKRRTPPGGTLGWVGPYQLVERLPYQGGPIEYLARQRGPFGFERTCRLKLVPLPSAGGDARAAEAVVREAKVVLRLDHPNIVRMLDLFEHGPNLVLVLDYFSNLSLSRLLELLVKQRKQLDERAVWHIAYRLFDALAHAHEVMDVTGPAPIVHSDVRPANVLVTADGRVRLSGFGFARQAGSEETTACGLSGSGPSYVAPEQVEGQCTERSDTYAAALIVWELLTGRPATPDGLGDMDRLKHISTRQVDSLRGLRPDVPPLVTTAMDTCLIADPAERSIQASEVAGCIAAAMDLRGGERALAEAVVSLGAPWDAMAAGDPALTPSPRSVKPGPPSSGSRKPAFSVIVPTPQESPVVSDALPPWDEITSVPVVPKTQVVDPRRSSPVAAIRSASEPPAMHSSLVPITSNALVDTLHPAAPRPRSNRQWVLAAPVVMVAAVVTFAAVGAFRSPAPLPAAGAVASTAMPRVEAPAAPATPVVSSAAQIEPVASSATRPVPSDRAILVVQSPPEGFVYIQGALSGKTGEAIETTCGTRFVRVGTTNERGMHDVTWLAPGQGILLRCGKRHEVAAKP